MSLISNDSGERLGGMREKIDHYDELIVALVAGRTALVLEIADEKQRLGLPTMVPSRHYEVVQHYASAVPEGSPMTQDDAARLSELVQEISRNAQDRYRAGEAAA